jgi:hypothetical protein
MELNLTSLYTRALLLNEAAATVRFGAERIRGAKRHKASTLNEINRFLKDFPSLIASQSFRARELYEMLGNTVVEASSYLFSAGAPDESWRAWAELAGEIFFFGEEYAYAMQLLTIARSAMPTEFSAALSSTKLSAYRDQVVRFIIFGPTTSTPPSAEPVNDLEELYQTLARAYQAHDEAALSQSVESIVRYWLAETSYGTFEPGIFPVFEPEINAVAAALLVQGFNLLLNKRVRTFLRAGLD